MKEGENSQEPCLSATSEEEDRIGTLGHRDVEALEPAPQVATMEKLRRSTAEKTSLFNAPTFMGWGGAEKKA